jgi:hypothetical protein
MKITIEDLKEWDACKDGYRWFIDTFGAEAELGELVAKCPKVKWVCWVCYKAGWNWGDDRYTPAIAEALVKTRDAEWLYCAGVTWAEARKKDLERSKNGKYTN